MFSSSTRESNRFLYSLVIAGRVLILGGIGVFLYSFGPLLWSEVRYSTVEVAPEIVRQALKPDVMSPVSSEFGIVIPKISANAPIVAEVNPFDAAEYQYQLSKGVAHAKGTGYPNDDATMFLFAHASGDFLTARRYNSIFYLLSKLEPTDEIEIYFNNEKYVYTVTKLLEVQPDEISFLENTAEADLIVMTCTPPGTTWRRLLVFGTLQE